MCRSMISFRRSCHSWAWAVVSSSSSIRSTSPAIGAVDLPQVRVLARVGEQRVGVPHAVEPHAVQRVDHGVLLGVRLALHLRRRNAP